MIEASLSGYPLPVIVAGYPMGSFKKNTYSSQQIVRRPLPVKETGNPFIQNK
jgi:hypothetical protein